MFLNFYLKNFPVIAFIVFPVSSPFNKFHIDNEEVSVVVCVPWYSNAPASGVPIIGFPSKS